MKVVDGTQLRSLHVALPDWTVTPLTVPQLLDLAESEASRALFNRPTLPSKLKSSALSRLHVDPIAGPTTEEYASSLVADFLHAIADALYEDPMRVSVYDGSTLKQYLEDEDEFAMLAEDLFTSLDVGDTGKIKRIGLRDALFEMGVDGSIIPPYDEGSIIPSFEDYPVLNDILKKHDVDGEGELGQSQFAKLLQPILQEVADALAEKPFTVIYDGGMVNGFKLRQILADEQQIDDIISKILKINVEEDQRGMNIIRSFLERNITLFGLPPIEEYQEAVSLFDAVFAEIDSNEPGPEKHDEFRKHVKEVLEKMAEQLDAQPVLCDGH